MGNSTSSILPTVPDATRIDLLFNKSNDSSFLAKEYDRLIRTIEDEGITLLLASFDVDTKQLAFSYAHTRTKSQDDAIGKGSIKTLRAEISIERKTKYVLSPNT